MRRRQTIERTAFLATLLMLGGGAMAACDQAADEDPATSGDGGVLDGTTGASDGTGPVGPDGASSGDDSGPPGREDGSTPSDDGGSVDEDGGGGDDEDGGALADGGGDEDDGGPIPVVTCTRTFGDGVSRNLVNSIDVDGRGNIVFSGTMTGTIDFGGGPLTSAGNGDMYLVKLNNRCNHVMSRRFGDAAEQFGGTHVRVDVAGNIYFAASFTGTVDLGLGATSTPANRYYTEIIKYGPDGAPLWHLVLKNSGTYGVRIETMTIDEQANLYFGGRRAPDDIQGHPVVPGAAFFASVDSDGNFRWVHTATSTRVSPQVNVQGVHVSGNEVWFAGRMLQNLDFGFGVVNHAQWGWLYRLNRDGTPIAVHDFDGADFFISRLGGRPCVFGQLWTTDVDLGTGPLNAVDTDGGKVSPDSFVALWKADGTGAQWVKTYGRRGTSTSSRPTSDISQMGDLAIAWIGPGLSYQTFGPDGGSGGSSGLPSIGEYPTSSVAPTNQFVVAGQYAIGTQADRVRVAKGSQRGVP